MQYHDWRQSFFNVLVSNPGGVIDNVHSGRPHGLPRIQQGLRPRGAQPHEIGFINTNSDINRRYETAVEMGSFEVTAPVAMARSNIIRSPNQYAQPSAFRISAPASFKTNISGGHGGIH